MYILWVGVGFFSSCMYMHHVQADAREGTRLSGTGVTYSCLPALGPLQKQPVLTAGPSLQSHTGCFAFCFCLLTNRRTSIRFLKQKIQSPLPRVTTTLSPPILASDILLSPSDSHLILISTSLVAISEDQLKSCGAKDCLMDTEVSNSTYHPSHQLIYTLLGIFNGTYRSPTF